MNAFYTQQLINALPYLFLFLVILELVIFLRNQPDLFSWRDWLSNIFLFGTSVKLFSFLIVSLKLNWLESSVAYLFSHGLKLIPDNKLSLSVVLIAFLVVDLLFFVQHYACHKIRFLWCIHNLHHSSEFFNLTTQYRHSIFGYFTRHAFFVFPLSWLGFYPSQISVSIALNFFFQAVLHTPAIKNLGFLELFLNTPSHHRVHHGINPQYVDKNFGSAFIVWDKLFKTFEPENEPVNYGITKKIDYSNVIKATFTECLDMFRDAKKARNFKEFINAFISVANRE